MSSPASTTPRRIPVLTIRSVSSTTCSRWSNPPKRLNSSDFFIGPATATAAPRSDGTPTLYVRLRNPTIILWSVYPLVRVLGSAGFGLLTLTVEATPIAYLDSVTKVGVGLIALDPSATMRSEFGGSPADTDAEIPSSAD
ncbi:MAG: bacteriorhodopsin [Halobacteriota archaeon]|uniref:bacteriorhodopsin n=1 Tax=Natronomonas sp. TaxID=2184060 RepID=UPI0039762348